MKAFLKKHLQDDTTPSNLDEWDKVRSALHPPFPNDFEITVINPAGMGSKGGIQVEQLHIPYRYEQCMGLIMEQG